MPYLFRSLLQVFCSLRFLEPNSLGEALSPHVWATDVVVQGWPAGNVMWMCLVRDPFGSAVGSCSGPLLMAYLCCRWCTYVAAGLLLLPMPMSTGLLIEQLSCSAWGLPVGFAGAWFAPCLSSCCPSLSRTFGAGSFKVVVAGCLHWCLCMPVGTSTYNYIPLVVASFAPRLVCWISNRTFGFLGLLAAVIC